MKRTKIITTLVAATAITASLMSTAFAAPAKNLLSQLAGTNGISLPTSGTVSSADLQKLLGQFKLPSTGTPGKNCPKKQALQDSLNKSGISLPGTGTGSTTPSPAPAATPSPAPTTGSGNTTPAPVTGSMSADEQKMVNLVNQDRAANGLKPLTFDSGLRSGAIAHSQDMSQNNYFSHTSPTQGDFTARIKASGAKYTSAGENIAMYGSVESAETGFMNSAGHRANILGDFTRVGIGIVYNQSKGTYYITQWFAK